MPCARTVAGPVVPRLRRPEQRRGAQHGEVVDALGVPGGQPHRRHAAEGEAHDVRPPRPEPVEQPEQVVGEVVDGVRPCRDGGAAVAAGVVADHAEVLRQPRSLGVPHGEGRAERVRQHDDGVLGQAGCGLDDVVDLHRPAHATASNTAAGPWPPSMHIVSRP